MPAGWWDSSFVGVRATGTRTGGDDRGWFERFRDLRGGPFTNVRFVRDAGDRSALMIVQNAGYRDQRYFAQYARPGRFKAYFEWDQIPLFYSEFTETPFAEVANGTLELAGAARQAAQRARRRPACTFRSSRTS